MTDPLARLTAALADRYRIERALGQGGMATVYLAEDLKHRRHVALKVLKPELAAVLGAERFVQEITTTASLQHPHILPLFDSGTADGFLFYVMPFIEGETLRARLDRETQLGVDEAVRIATDVADALQYAHEHGVIHRDIKPENILLQNGRPMVADFGIALAVSAAAGGRMTETGLSLGTPHYMSPEQATAEKEITARSDVYSLASVLYEMLAGQPPHLGGSAQQIIMKIIAEPVPLVTQFRKTVPPNVAEALAKGLEKLPADRFASASAFAHALGDAAFRAGTGSYVEAGGARATVSPRFRVGLAVAVLALVGSAYLVGRRTAPQPSVVDVGLPDTAQFAFVDDTPWGTELPGLVVSPDGDFAVYVARRGAYTELWYRSLVDAEARPLPGTRGANVPAISPDGRWVSFVSGRVLKKVAVDGSSPAVDVAEVASPWGTIWTGPDELLVAAEQGTRTEWIRMSDGAKSRIGGPCAFPASVPGTNTLLCHPASSYRWIRVVTLTADGSVPMSPTAGTALGDSIRPVASDNSFIVGSRLVFVNGDGNLEAAPYDRTTGVVGARSIVQRGLRRSLFTRTAHLGVTRAGDLVFVPGSNGAVGQFVAMQPGGGARVLPIPAKEHLNFSVTADGRRIAATARGVEGTELWIYDGENGQGDRVAVGFDIGYPVWASDGTLVFVIRETAAKERATMLLPADGGAAIEVADLSASPSAFPTRRTLVASSEAGGDDIIVVTLDGNRVVLADTLRLPNNQYYPVVSPDQRWLAYSGTEKGIAQLFVTRFPAMDRQYKVSVDAAAEPVWLPDGSLVHRKGSCWYRLRPQPGATPPLAAPVLAFCDDKLLNTSGPSNTAMPDGSILYLRTVAPTTAGYLRIVRNWRKTLDGAPVAGGSNP
jgi:eukaryotic-like serine/threonine-protein kinase